MYYTFSLKKTNLLDFKEKLLTINNESLEKDFVLQVVSDTLFTIIVWNNVFGDNNFILYNEEK